MNLGLTDAGTGWVETVGVDVASRNPRVEHVPGRLVARALEHIVAMIVSSVREMLSDIPPNLAEDVDTMADFERLAPRGGSRIRSLLAVRT